MADDQTRRLGKDPSTLFLAGAYAAPLILPCLWISFAADLGAVALGGVALAVLLLIQVSMATAYGRSISHWKILAFNIAHRRRLGAGKTETGTRCAALLIGSPKRYEPPERCDLGLRRCRQGNRAEALRCIPVDRDPESVLLHTHMGGSVLMSKHFDNPKAGRAPRKNSRRGRWY